MMIKLQLFLLLVANVSLGARRLRGNDRVAGLERKRRDVEMDFPSLPSFQWGAKSLVNTFPFNADNAEIHEGHHEGHHNGHHEEHHAAPSNSVQGLFDARDSRQGGDDVDVSFPAVAAAGPGAD